MEKYLLLSLLCGLLSFNLTACGGRADTAQSAESNVEATVQAAVAATSTAQVAIQATIDAAVAATAVAQTSQATATPAPAPTPVVVTQTVTEIITETVYVPQDVYMTMTEAELAQLIDDAVTQATTATQTSSTAATAATADGAVTSTDVATVEVYVEQASADVAYAEELVAAYYELYGATADEVLEAVAGVEAELATVAESTTAMATSLAEIETTLNAGLALAEESVDQLEQAAATAANTAGELQTQVDTLTSSLQTKAATYNQTAQALQTQFATVIEQIQPQEVAGDQAGAFRSVFTYMDTVRGALGDNAIDMPEMQMIAQTGANAFASLNTHGGPRWSGLSPAINDVTNAIALGDLDRAHQGLNDVEARLPTRDSVGGLRDPAAGNRRP